MTFDLVLEHWELALLVTTWFVIGVLAAKRRYDWQQRRFAQQVNFSLNTLVEDDGARLRRSAMRTTRSGSA